MAGLVYRGYWITEASGNGDPNDLAAEDPLTGSESEDERVVEAVGGGAASTSDRHLEGGALRHLLTDQDGGRPRWLCGRIVAGGHQASNRTTDCLTQVHLRWQAYRPLLFGRRIQSVLFDRQLHGLAPRNKLVHFVVREGPVDDTLQVLARRRE